MIGFLAVNSVNLIKVFSIGWDGAGLKPGNQLPLRRVRVPFAFLPQPAVLNPSQPQKGLHRPRLLPSINQQSRRQK